MYRVSPSFVTKWCRILDAAERAGTRVKRAARPLSTRPKSCCAHVQNEIEKDVVRAKKENPCAGPLTIKHMIRTDASPTTVYRVLKKNKLTKRDKPHKKRKYIRFEERMPMARIQLDYKTWGPGMYSIWALDDHSRAILGYRVTGEATGEVVKDLMEEVAETYGVPGMVRTDHGLQFLSKVFSGWMKTNSVKHVMGRVGHPQTNGKIERSHRTAKKEAPMFGPAGTLEDLGATVGKWIGYYNWERPHRSLNMLSPMTVFHRDAIEDVELTSVPGWTELFGLA